METKQYATKQPMNYWKNQREYKKYLQKVNVIAQLFKSYKTQQKQFQEESL